MCVCVCFSPPTGQSEYQEVALICICWLSYACVLTLTSHKWSLFCRESVYLALVHDKNRNVIRCINCKCIVHNWIFEHVSKQWGNLILIIQFTFFFFPWEKRACLSRIYFNCNFHMTKFTFKFKMMLFQSLVSECDESWKGRQNYKHLILAWHLLSIFFSVHWWDITEC